MKRRSRAASCRRLRRRRARSPAAGTGSDVPSESASQGAGDSGGQQFPGIVGTSSTVITAQEIAHRPQQTLPEIIAQVPGVQLQSLFGGVNGAKTSVDLRGFGAFATANTLILVNGRRLNDVDMAQVDLSTIPLDSIERIEITRGNSGAVLYGDNAIGGVINIVPKNGVGGPPVAIRGRGRCRLLQPAHGRCLRGAEFGTVVDVVLRQRHQVRRLSRQQRARPAQRHRQSQLHHARPQGLPDGDRRRPEARLPRRPLRRSLDRRSTNWSPTARAPATPFDYGNQQGASATAGFTKTLWNGVDLIVDGGCAQEGYAKRFLRHRCVRDSPISSSQPSTMPTCRPGRSRRG